MVLKLMFKKCTECNTHLTTIAKVPLCQMCIKRHCVMEKCENINGARRCNVTVDLIDKCGQMYCMGHYKKACQYCKKCKRPRREDEQDDKLFYDGWFYCFRCEPSRYEYEKFLINYFDDVLNNDIMKYIIGILNK